MAKNKIVLKIRDGNFQAEGIGFNGKSCEDKMSFLNKMGEVLSKKNKKEQNPEPGPHVNIHHK